MKFDFQKFVEVIKTVAPVVLVAVPGGQVLAPIVPAIVHGIEQAEQIPGASGIRKKEHVLEIVKSATAVANAAGARLDPAAVQDAAGKGIDAVIGTVKIVEGARPAKGGVQ